MSNFNHNRENLFDALQISESDAKELSSIISKHAENSTGKISEIIEAILINVRKFSLGDDIDVLNFSAYEKQLAVQCFMMGRYISKMENENSLDLLETLANLLTHSKK